jgi:hypothetical protein
MRRVCYESLVTLVSVVRSIELTDRPHLRRGLPWDRAQQTFVTEMKKSSYSLVSNRSSL